MKQIRLEAQLRSGTGKGAARAVRRSGLIPGVLYGQKKDTLPIQIDQRKLKSLLKIEGIENSLINLELAGHAEETIMIKEIQRDPIHQEILHTDLIRISLDEKVTTTASIIIIGIPVGVSDGGVEEFSLRELHIKCLPTQIPEHIEVDVSELEMGDMIRVSNLNIPEGIEVLDALETVVVSVRQPTIIEEKPSEEELVFKEAIEPEVVGRTKEEEEKV